jgi:hypothetical protein
LELALAESSPAGHIPQVCELQKYAIRRDSQKGTSFSLLFFILFSLLDEVSVPHVFFSAVTFFVFFFIAVRFQREMPFFGMKYTLQQCMVSFPAQTNNFSKVSRFIFMMVSQPELQGILFASLDVNFTRTF